MTMATAEHIRALAAEGIGAQEIARRVNRSRQRVYQVLGGRRPLPLPHKRCEARAYVERPVATARCRNEAIGHVRLDGRGYDICGRHLAMSPDDLWLRLSPMTSFEDITRLYRLAHPRAGKERDDGEHAALSVP